MRTIAVILLLGWNLPAVVSDEVLEPSVLNEVEHALARVPAGAATNRVVALSADWPCRDFAARSPSDRAIALVSAQRADGRWFAGTNDVTGNVCLELRRLAGEETRP